jgi:hypothetical protein
MRNEFLSLFKNGPIVIDKFELLFQCRAKDQVLSISVNDVFDCVNAPFKKSNC